MPSNRPTHKRKHIKAKKKHMNYGVRLYHVGSEQRLFCPRCQQRVKAPHEVSE